MNLIFIFVFYQNLSHKSSGMNLSDLKINDAAVILNISGDEEKLRRLSELGIHPGRPIQILQKTPFNGPIVILVEQTFIALRSEEALCIQIKPN